MRPSLFTAPTASMSVASAGTPIFFQVFMPEFPAELQCTMPFRASSDAVREMRAVCPSRFFSR